MPRPSRSVWAWFLLAFTGCSLVTDFDRDKLGAQPGSDEAGVSVSPMDAQTLLDAGPGPAPGDDDAMSGGEDTGPAAACQTHTDCGRGRLCCNGSCLPNTETNCTECGQGCSQTAANTCNDRVCGCGGGAACSGTTPHCLGEGARASCVQCRDASDCSMGMQCVRGTCAQCDPMNNSGCSGNTPICNSNTLRCEACRASPDNCPGAAAVCTPSGACGGCTANDAADCTTPTSPICNLSANPSVCRGCASNAECMTELTLPYCISNERCSICNPADDTGCTAGSATPDCRLNANGVFQCQGCMNGTCPTGQLCNLTSGRCVQCRSDNDCETNSAAPWCDTSTGTCRGCNFVPNSIGGGTTWCALTTLLQSPQRPACHSSGRCIRCNANGDCPNNQRCFIPDATMPQNNVCGACRPNVAADCPAGMPICDPGSRTCRRCQTGDCTGQNVCGAAGGCVRCRVGESGPGAGCMNPNQAQCIMGTAGPECVQCATGQHSQCPTDAPLCNPATHACVACGAFSGNATEACRSKTPGTVCTNAGTCATCDTADHDGCALSQLCCPGAQGPACADTGPLQCSTCGAACVGDCMNRVCSPIVPDAGLPITLPAALNGVLP